MKFLKTFFQSATTPAQRVKSSQQHARDEEVFINQELCKMLANKNVDMEKLKNELKNAAKEKAMLNEVIDFLLRQQEILAQRLKGKK